MNMDMGTTAMDMGSAMTTMVMGSVTTVMGSMATSNAAANLSLGDPNCNSNACPAFLAGYTESQASVSYAYQFHYGEWLSYYYVAILFLAMVAYFYRLWTFRKTIEADSGITWTDKVVAVNRSLTYRRIPGAVGVYLGLPSYGLLALTLFSLALIMAMSFAIHPYYRLYRGFGSPPLAIRTGLMAVALTPLIYALAGKYNLITLITGVSHEKLNVFHRYISYACLILSIIHTVPYLINDGAGPLFFGLAGLNARFYATGSYEFTGTPPFGIIVFLAFFSIPYFRHRVYELFKYSHYIASIVYLGLMFWHCGNQGNSWYYLYATVAVFVLSLLGRLFFKTSSIFGRHVATIQTVGPSMLKISVFTPAGMRWSPGQHVFLRFPSIRVFANHPFTIANVPAGKSTESQEMVLLIRPYKGFTAILHSMAVASPSSELSLSVDIGGPYSSLGVALERRYGGVVLVAGGGGITSVLPWILNLSEKMDAGENCATKEVVLLWVVQYEDAISWVGNQLLHALQLAPQGSITIKIFVTRSKMPIENSSTEEVTDEKGQNSKVKSSSTEWTIEYGRPNLKEIVPRELRQPRTVVLECGPESMRIDVSNAIAAAQSQVSKGKLKEIALHTESFGW